MRGEDGRTGKGVVGEGPAGEVGLVGGIGMGEGIGIWGVTVWRG